MPTHFDHTRSRMQLAIDVDVDRQPVAVNVGREHQLESEVRHQQQSRQYDPALFHGVAAASDAALREMV